MELIGAIAFVLISIVTAFYAYFKYSFEYWKSRGIPHEKPSIPYGNAKGFGKTLHRALFAKKFYDKFKSTGAKLCGVHIFARPVAILMDLELIKTVMVKDFANFNERGLYYNEEDDPLSAHLFALDNEKWRKLRTKLTPAFTCGKMKLMFPTIVNIAEQMRECLLESVHRDQQIDMREILFRFTTDVIGTCAYGIECNSLKNPDAEFRYYGRKIFGKPRHSDLFLAFLNGFKNTSRKLRVKSIPDEVSNFFMKVVMDTVEHRERNNVNRNDFMDLLIKLKNGSDDKEKAVTPNEIAAQAYVFFLAGFDTSTSMMAFCLYELALNPEIQDKARRAIQEAYDRHDGPLTHDMTMDMPYIDQVLEEVLRKYPNVSVLFRLAQNDYRVPGSETVIEKGTSIFIPIYAIQNDADYYPNPEKFDPDRFSSEAKKQRNTSTWMPFGEGPRNCIGKLFAMMVARIGIVTLLRNFEFSIGTKTVVPLEFDNRAIFLSPKDSLYLKLKAIE